MTITTLPTAPKPAGGYRHDFPHTLVTRWSWIDLPRPCPLVKRKDLKPGMVFVSSHSGQVRLTEVIPSEHPQGSTFLRYHGYASGVVLNTEVYPNEDTVPLLLDEHGFLAAPPSVYCTDWGHLDARAADEATHVCPKCEGPVVEP
jgi:hypothetical protein